jgi:hypothetical protein
MKILGILISLSLYTFGFTALGDDGTAVDYSAAEAVTDSLKTVRIPALDTTVLFSGATLVAPDSDAVFILFGGTGARTIGYGIVPSFKDVASKIIKLSTEQFKLKASVVGFENSIYAGNPEQYGSAQAQVEMMLRDISLIVSLIPKDENGRVTKKIWVEGRSTGAAVIAQMLHEYYIGRPGREVVGQLDGVLMMGLLGHNPDEIKTWGDREDEFFKLKENQELLDVSVQPYGKKIFEGMTWGPSQAKPAILAPNRRLPKVIVTMGSNDFESPVEKQFEVAKRFSDLHPQLSVMGYGMDTTHNPAAPTTYVNRQNKEVKRPRMDRFSPLKEGIAAHMTQIPYKELKLSSKIIATVLDASVPGFSPYAISQMFDGPSFINCEEAMKLFPEENIISPENKKLGLGLGLKQ